MLKKYKYPLLFVAAMLLSYLTNTFLYQRDSTGPHLATLFLVLCTIILLNCKHWLPAVAGFIITLIFSLEVGYFTEFHERISAGVLDSALETNNSEATLMLGHYLYSIILPALCISVLIFICFRRKRLRLPRWFTLSPVFIFGFLMISLLREVIPEYRNLSINFSEDPYELGTYLREKFPVVAGNIMYVSSVALSHDKYTENYPDRKPNRVLASAGKPQNKLIIFIIGESSSPSRYHIYGYSKETTPEMERIFQGDKACVTDKVHSSSPITRDSISLSLSFYTPESEENLFRQKSVIEIAQDQGYKTYWLGAQSLVGVNGSKYGYLARRNNTVIVEENNDMKLPELLKQALAEPDEYKFIILHLWGNHMPYTNYTETEKQQLNGAGDYDLTIRHTDNVIGRLYDEVESVTDDYIFIYTSDHGEIVGKGHGFSKGADQFLIPFLYKSGNPSYGCEFIEKYRNQDGWISGLMNKYILSELLGYSLDQSIAEPDKQHDRILSTDGYAIPFSSYFNKNK
ncbi:phosphoethanolamine transferase [Morganella morganii]|uniref:phosphoethanolamine transferase n=1 Tax=Morganella morganii TaxID=582 RepID=UPI0011CE292B|nr:phosphoethanolamine transferase [Morganella morganii]MBT0381380.1 phosphoethanolamine transferase [Morganella morganii subsp. morganii]MBT0419783.1 phosphoethanolamine transferase [Morganella morganii subsp. morganii]MBT0514711.1 phosphoethanolamine transferase [Morganella morganii subsp. morganii]MCU6355896.1 phosphoethanolamine transferase [Morganella morganii]QWM02837.1 phosphoethanolamine transferase [Morganella morganii subsp. morganii]